MCMTRITFRNCYGGGSPVGKNPPWWPQKRVRTNRPIHTRGHINKSHVQMRPGLSLRLLTAVLSQSLAQGCSHPNTQTTPSAHSDIIYTTATKSRLARTLIPSCRVQLHPHAHSNYSVPTASKTAFTIWFLTCIRRINDFPVISTIRVNASQYSSISLGI